MEHVQQRLSHLRQHFVNVWAGVHIGALEAAPWTMGQAHLFATVEVQIIDACRTNGYIDHPNGGEPEILRTFNDGRRAGAADPAPEPELYESRPNGFRLALTQPEEPGPQELERPAIDPLAASQSARWRAHQLALPVITNR